MAKPNTLGQMFVYGRYQPGVDPVQWSLAAVKGYIGPQCTINLYRAVSIEVVSNLEPGNFAGFKPSTKQAQQQSSVPGAVLGTRYPRHFNRMGQLGIFYYYRLWQLFSSSIRH
ncbi:hypothetical protein [Shewanella sp. 10B]|uniref:hypothetical protein n=1 Tax=Shewanella sp. 10B TaxID=2943322 RepID=UPI00201B2E54|nr:hypothetical protein [Shewanella sp. 10B]